MRLAIMQPYFFPYIGYWQLMSAVDKFVIYEDVNYITKGWINRNLILINGESHFLTVPLKQVSQNKKICQIEIADDAKWRKKMMRTIDVTYGRAPFYPAVVPMVEEIIYNDVTSLSKFLAFLIKRTAKSLGITCQFELSSIYRNSHESGEPRIVDICRIEAADVYVNPAGGQELYRWETFRDAGIELYFLDTEITPAFLPNRRSGKHLSILHLLMRHGYDGVANMLPKFRLKEPSSVGRKY